MSAIYHRLAGPAKSAKVAAMESMKLMIVLIHEMLAWKVGGVVVLLASRKTPKAVVRLLS